MVYSEPQKEDRKRTTLIMLHNQNKYIMAEKLEFSEKLVYDYFKQHKLHKSGADAVIQMVQFARSEETEPSEALKETINRYPVSYTHLTLPTIIRECRSRWSPYH